MFGTRRSDELAPLMPRCVLHCPPVVRSFLVVELPNASNMRHVPILLRPRDSFVLRLVRGEYVIRMILHHIVVNWIALGATFRTRFNVDVRHHGPPDCSLADLPWRARPIGPKGFIKGTPRALRWRYASSMIPQG